jgi:hypothetical protein
MRRVAAVAALRLDRFAALGTALAACATEPTDTEPAPDDDPVDDDSAGDDDTEGDDDSALYPPVDVPVPGVFRIVRWDGGSVRLRRRRRHGHRRRRGLRVRSSRRRPP